jgi:hypothetical protein
MPRRSKIPVPKLRLKRKLKGDGFFDTISSWGRSVINAYTPKLITGIPAPSYEPDPTPPPSNTGLPDKSILKDIADNSYKGTSDEMKDIPGFTLKLKTPTIVIYQKDTENVMVIGVRGTADFRDFKAWFSTAFNVIPDSQRFKEDIQTISDFQQKYPVNTFTYYATGHSLGGTLIDELIKKGMVKEARTYNPAIETSDIPDVALSQKNHRIYADGDPLYLLQGRFDNPTEVRKSYKYYPSSVYDFVPGYDKYKQHVLANPVFVGGELKSQPSLMNSNPFYHLQGAARPYTAEQWEQKLCKGENSLLAQKKRKIKERAERGVPPLEAPMRTSRVIKATPPKEQEKEVPFADEAEANKRKPQAELDALLERDKRFYSKNAIMSRRKLGVYGEKNKPKAVRTKSAPAKKAVVERQEEEEEMPDWFRNQLTEKVFEPNEKWNEDKSGRLRRRVEIQTRSIQDAKQAGEDKEVIRQMTMLLGKAVRDADGYDKLKSSGSGMMANSQFYRTDPKRNPLLRGEGIWDDIKSGIEKVVGKPPVSAHHVWTPAEQADINRRQRIIDVDKQRAKYIAQKKQVAVDDLMKNAQYPNVLKALYGQQGADNAKDYLQRIVERATQGAERMYPY